MGRPKVNAWATQFKQALAPETVDALGYEAGLCQRRRRITPWRLAVSLLDSLSTGHVECLTDLQRAYNRMFDRSVANKAFHKQLAKAGFADFMRTLTGHLLAQLQIQVLKPQPGGALSEFDRIVIQDGSSFSLKSDLADVYPGRFTAQDPAAVELHTTLELFEGTPSRIGLTPDTWPERAHVPDADTLAGSVLLADRGYFKRASLAALDAAGACFVVRANGTINPHVVRAFNGQGRRRPKRDDQSFKTVRRASHDVLDLDVAWESRSNAWPIRLIARWNPGKHEYHILVTNLPRARYSAKQVQQVYRLRWQIELLFKEYKSYANLHAFDTANPDIAEGMIWAAVAAATLKRFIAHAAQRVHGVMISSQKVAKCAGPVLLYVFEALAQLRRLKQAFVDALDYLAANAQRAHPRRDQQSGRLQFGIVPVM